MQNQLFAGSSHPLPSATHLKSKPSLGSLSPSSLQKIASTSTKSSRTNSINFFATKIEVDNDEAPLEQPNQEPLVRLTYYKGHRSGRWEAFHDGLCRPNYYDENVYRTPKIKELLKSFLKLKEKFATVSGKEIKDLENKIIANSESILSLYNINLNVMQNPVVDSHLELVPAKNRFEIARGLLALIPELCRFPYSFYAKIDLISLTFCGGMLMLKSESKKLIEKRLFNGLFPLGVLQTEEQIINHFYRVLVFLIKAMDPDFDRKLTRVATIKKSRTMLMNATNFIVSESVKSKKDNGGFDYQSRLLRCLITNPHSVLLHQSDAVSYKGVRLRGVLESLDSDGLSIEFWNQIEGTPIKEALEFLEDKE